MTRPDQVDRQVRATAAGCCFLAAFVIVMAGLAWASAGTVLG